jgi:hypothetical protein
MKKYIFLSILLIAAPLFAADYYVNVSTGSDAAAGGSSTPWKTPAFADEMVSAGDTLTIVAAATSPDRSGIRSNTAGAITIGGTSATTRAYILGASNVSHNAEVDYLPNGGFEAWLDPTDTDGAGSPDTADLWVLKESDNADNEIEADSSTVHGGTYSCKMTEVAGHHRVYWDFLYLPASTPVTFTLWYYNDGTHTTSIQITRTDGSAELSDDYQSWTNDGNTIACDNSNGAWDSKEIAFTTSTAGRYVIMVWTGDGPDGTTYIDDASLTATYQWAQVDGENYYKLTPAIVSQDEPKILAKSTATAWATSGVEALTVVPTASDLTACGTTANSWVYDSGFVYYHPPSDETVSSMHFEAGKNFFGQYGDLATGVLHPVYITHDDYTLQNLEVRMANGSAVVNNGGTGFEGANIDARYGYSCVYYFYGGATGSLHDCYGAYTYDEDVILASGSGTDVDIYRCTATEAHDDCIQVATDATGALYWNLAYLCGNEEAGNNSGIVAEQAAAFTAYNNTVYGNYGKGIYLKGRTAGSTFDVQNNITWGNGTSDIGYEADNDDTVTALDYNCWENEDGYGADWSGAAGANETNTDPALDSAYRPSSAFLSAGTKIVGFHDATVIGQRDVNDNFVAPYKIPMGAQGYVRPSGYGKHLYGNW